MKNLIVRTAMVVSRDINAFHKNLENSIEVMQNDTQIQDVQVQYCMENSYFSALLLGREKVEDR